jgi:hypothetical protein
MPLRLISVWSLLLAACPAPVTELDGGGVDASVQAFESPRAPAAPQGATLTPCPPGWNEVPGNDGAPVTCEPWGPALGACGADEARFTTSAACQRVGTECTADDWALTVPANALFVKAQAPSGGTGTRASPFASIAAAMAVATPGTTLALSKGTFAENVRLKAGVTLWGACVGQTVLQGPGGVSTVTTMGLGGGLRNLRVTGTGVGLTANPSGNSVELHGVAFEGLVGIALLVGNRAVVTGDDVVVRRTQPSPTRGGGRGLDVEYGGQVTLARVVLEGNAENAVNVAEAGSTVVLSDAVLRTTVARGDGAMGRGATVRAMASLTLTRAVVEENREVALLVGNGSTLALTDVVVRDTRSSTNLNDSGHGLVVEVTAKATVSRCAFLRNRGLGLEVRAQGQLTASDVVVFDTAVDASTGADGAGVNVIESSQLTLERVFVGRSHSASLGVTASTATLRDVVLHGAQRSVADDFTSGLQIDRGARVTVERVRVDQSDRIGVFINGAGSVLSGTDLIISESRCSPTTGEDGAGLVVAGGGTAQLERAWLSKNRTVGVQVDSAPSSAFLTDLLVEDTDSDVGGQYGRGLHVQGGGLAILSRAAFDRSRDVGLFVGSGSTVTADALRIDTVAKRACVAARSCDDVGGSSLVVLGAGSKAEVTAFSLAHSVQCGVELAQDGVATLSAGEIVGHVVGACVETTNFDLARLQTQVEYRDNVQKLDSSSLPLPTLTLPVPASR